MTDTDKIPEGSDDNDAIQGDRIIIGEISGSSGLAIGRGATSISGTEKDLRDIQYEIVLNWDGKRLLRGFDLSERDLSGLNLAKADLRKANLRAADLSKTNLAMADLSKADLSDANMVEADLSDANMVEADLSEASLSGARYTDKTTWPRDFNPGETGAVLVSGKKSLWTRLFG